MKLIKTIDNTSKVTKQLLNLSKRKVLVGVPSTKDSRQLTGAARNAAVQQLQKTRLGSTKQRKLLHQLDSTINNAAIAFIQDKGSDKAHIPARPFLSAGILAASKQVSSRMAAVGRAALANDAPAVERGLHAVGLTAVNAVKRKITTGPFQPLAPRTLAARRSRGVTRTKPLIDTGQLRNAQSYVVK